MQLIDYFILYFPGIVLAIGIIGGAILVIGGGKNKEKALKNFDNELKIFGSSVKRGKELSHNKKENNEERRW